MRGESFPTSDTKASEIPAMPPRHHRPLVPQLIAAPMEPSDFESTVSPPSTPRLSPSPPSLSESTNSLDLELTVNLLDMLRRRTERDLSQVKESYDQYEKILLPGVVDPG